MFLSDVFRDLKRKNVRMRMGVVPEYGGAHINLDEEFLLKLKSLEFLATESSSIFKSEIVF